MSMSGPGIPAISLSGGVDSLYSLCCMSQYMRFGFGQECAQMTKETSPLTISFHFFPS